LSWKAQIDGTNGRHASPLEHDAWRKLADTYFRGEQQTIRSKTFRTTSDRYTELVGEVTNGVADSLFAPDTAPGDPPLVRIHITGMLPEEFYNGPQIEYTRASSEPIFFCHRWENYPVLYG